MSDGHERPTESRRPLLTGLLGLFVLAHLWLAYRHDWLASQIRETPAHQVEERESLRRQCLQLLDGVGFLLRLTRRDCAADAYPVETGAESD